MRGFTGLKIVRKYLNGQSVQRVQATRDFHVSHSSTVFAKELFAGIFVQLIQPRMIEEQQFQRKFWMDLKSLACLDCKLLKNICRDFEFEISWVYFTTEKHGGRLTPLADTLLKRGSKSHLVATEFRGLQLFVGQER